MTQPDSIRYTGLAHASVLVRDTGTAVVFYCDILGMILDPSRPNLDFPGVWLRVGEQQIHLLELLDHEATQAHPVHGGRDRHIAVRVTNLDAVSARLESAAIPFSRSRSGRHALFCRDPDGNALEFIEDVA